MFKLEQTSAYRNMVIKPLGNVQCEDGEGGHRVTFKMCIRVTCYEGGPGSGLCPLVA